MSRAQRHALRSRVKHMQRLGFPKPGVTKGFVASYSVEDLVKVVIAFALLEAGMPSVRACALVLSVWPEPGRVMAGAGAAAPTLVVRPHALSTVGIRGLDAQAKAEAVAVGGDAGDGERAKFSATRITVDLSTLSERLRRVLTGDIVVEGLGTTVADEDYRKALGAI